MRTDDAKDELTLPLKLLRAAKYVRMSTEHQQYSTKNQADKIEEYAERHGIEVVCTYADEGKSGLSIDGRASLQKLIADVESGNTDFTFILVYDVSRWGRFQDADESAYYEYICKRRGISVVYVAEQFENDGSPVSTIVKGVKRAMAGEYSRELSAKVFAGQCRLVELGFRQGGSAGFGLRRMLIDQSGGAKGELARGEVKSLQTDRVLLVPGPTNEVEIVNEIFHLFIEQGMTETDIAQRLNERGLKNDYARDWRPASVRQILSNEKYVGNNVYNRTSFKLKKLKVVNAPNMWIKKEGAFEAIVPPEVFYTAQGMIRAKSYRHTDEELITRLRNLYQKRGFLSGLVIDESEETPSAATYRFRFGTLLRAYQAVGFTPDRDYHYLEINQFLRRMHPEVVQQTEQKIEALGGTVERDPATDLLLLNREFSVSLVLARAHTCVEKRVRWRIRFDTSLAPDITVAVRLNQENSGVLDYYLLPRLDFLQSRISLGERNHVELETYRFESLEFLYKLAERSAVRRAA